MVFEGWRRRVRKSLGPLGVGWWDCGRGDGGGGGMVGV